jgi:hypothetical protein
MKEFFMMQPKWRKALAISVLFASILTSCSRGPDSGQSDVAKAPLIESYPKEILCRLSLLGGYPDDSDFDFNAAHSCSDYTVESEYEKSWVSGLCELSASLKGYTWKLESGSCSKDESYAVCAVKTNIPSAPLAETYYYLGAEATQKNKDLIAQNCRSLGGELKVFEK